MNSAPPTSSHVPFLHHREVHKHGTNRSFRWREQRRRSEGTCPLAPPRPRERRGGAKSDGSRHILACLDSRWWFRVFHSHERAISSQLRLRKKGNPVKAKSHGLPSSELEDIRATVMLRPLRSDFNEGSPATLSFTGDSEVAEKRVQAPFIQPIQLVASLLLVSEWNRPCSAAHRVTFSFVSRRAAFFLKTHRRF